MNIIYMFLLFVYFLFPAFNIIGEELTDPASITIEALRQRNYSSPDIKIVKTLGNKGAYNSYVVSYVSEGLILFALMNVPDSRATKLPAVIVNHGYIPPGQFSTVKSYKNISHMYASNGFLVLKPDYRGHGDSPGRTEGPERTILYSIDVLNLLEALPSLSRVDQENVFMYGHSMGGEITLRVLEISDRIKAATLWAPVTAPFPENTLYFTRKNRSGNLDQFEADIARRYSEEDNKKISPINHTAYIKIPLLIHHGTADESVPYAWSLNLEKELKKNKIKYTFHTYEKENHNLSKGSYFKVVERDVVFFNKYRK